MEREEQLEGQDEEGGGKDRGKGDALPEHSLMLLKKKRGFGSMNGGEGMESMAQGDTTESGIWEGGYQGEFEGYLRVVRMAENLASVSLIVAICRLDWSSRKVDK